MVVTIVTTISVTTTIIIIRIIIAIVMIIVIIVIINYINYDYSNIYQPVIRIIRRLRCFLYARYIGTSVRVEAFEFDSSIGFLIQRSKILSKVLLSRDKDTIFQR